MEGQRSKHVDDPAQVGLRVKEARLRARMTLSQLAFPDCSSAHLSRIEAGKRTPSLPVLLELAHRLGLSPSELAWGDRDANGCVHILRSEGRSGLALGAYRQALALAQTRRERAWALAGIGQLALEGNDIPRARAALEEALATVSETASAEPRAAEG